MLVNNENFNHTILSLLNVCSLFPATTNTKAALKSKIVAEFTVGLVRRSASLCLSCCVSHPLCSFALLFLSQPHSLIEQLARYKRAVAEEELREKQLAALRVDVCSAEALKRLKGQILLLIVFTNYFCIITPSPLFLFRDLVDFLF